MKRSSKVVLWSCLTLCVYLTAEAFLPVASQPSARVAVALVRGYQSTGSPALQSMGVRCRYFPSCSHYAVDSISHYGTVSGVTRTAGRLFRCSPWGGSGFDPAVEPHDAAYLAPQEYQETPEQKKAREDLEREWNKLRQDIGEEAPIACGMGIAACVIAVISMLVAIGIQVFMMVFTYKDAKARGDQNAVLWLVLIFFLHWVGFVVYIIARPKGDLTPCPNCHQKKLDILTKCPHCGTEIASAPPKPPAA